MTTIWIFYYCTIICENLTHAENWGTCCCFSKCCNRSLNWSIFPKKLPIFLTQIEASGSQMLFLSRFNFRGFRWMKTMIHTIKEINERKDILPNHTLGYQIFDTCFSVSKAMETALAFLTGQEENKPNFRNSTGKYLVGIIGAGGSSLSVAAARILGLYYIPQVTWNSVLCT